MGVDANAIVTKGYGPLEIMNFLNGLDCVKSLNISPTSIENMVILNFEWLGEQRHMYCHYNGSCSCDYEDVYPFKDGCLVSIGHWGFSDAIIMKIAENFGGFFRLNDCTDEWEKSK